MRSNFIRIRHYISKTLKIYNNNILTLYNKHDYTHLPPITIPSFKKHYYPTPKPLTWWMVAMTERPAAETSFSNKVVAKADSLSRPLVYRQNSNVFQPPMWPKTVILLCTEYSTLLRRTTARHHVSFKSHTIKDMYFDYSISSSWQNKASKSVRCKET